MRVRVSGSSGRGRANVSGRPVASGGKSASEIRGTKPSSRRRLAQNAASITASMSAAAGAGMAALPAAREVRRAKCSSMRGATAWAGG
jgi:hypothetical protein